MSCCIQCCCIYPLALRAIPATALGRACGIIDPRERDGGRQAVVASLAGCGLVCGPVFVGGSITQYPDGVILGPSWAILGAILGPGCENSQGDPGCELGRLVWFGIVRGAPIKPNMVVPGTVNQEVKTERRAMGGAWPPKNLALLLAPGGCRHAAG